MHITLLPFASPASKDTRFGFMPASQLASIWIAPEKGAPMQSLGQVELEKDRGIVGDRYHKGEGTFSRWQRLNRAVSFIKSEALADILAETGLDLSKGLHRRNLVTAGISLTDLIGGHFRIGTVLFRASATCPPCRYLERLIGPGTFEALRRRGGIRAEVIESGSLKIGDPIIPVGPARRLP